MGRVTVFASAGCSHCARAKAFLDARGVPHAVIDLTTHPARLADQRALTGSSSVPQVLFNREVVGGADDLEALEAELERPKAFKCGTFGHTSLAERQLATGDFDGSLAVWDLEKLQQPVFSVKGHDTIINCIDGCGGMRGAGAPEIATGGRDGAVHLS